MRRIVTTALLLAIASTANAGMGNNYKSDDAILVDLKMLVGWCDEMVDGQVRTEVFGLLFVKNGSKCQFSNGELDDQMRKYFNDNQLTWAGVEGEHGLWVEDSSND